MKCTFCRSEGAYKHLGTSKHMLCERCYKAFSSYYNYKRRGDSLDRFLYQFNTVIYKLHDNVIPMCVPRYLRTDLLEYNKELIVEKDNDNLFGDII